MGRLYELGFRNVNSDLGALLACDRLEAGAANGLTRRLCPSTVNRTLIIGLGGIGVQTVDHIKEEISKRMDPSWVNYIAFLGIDTSWTELDRAANLSPNEKILTTLHGVDHRMAHPASIPMAVRSFFPENTRCFWDGDSANRARLVGKVKIHDCAMGTWGIDEQIVNEIARIKLNNFAARPLFGPGKYEVYVIGSVCGGTCGGGLLELPALIRKALGSNTLVHALLFLPDLFAHMDPAHEEQLKANGYATLKELNYYMGMYMRDGYSEKWSYNDGGSPYITLTSSISNEGFIDIPYLVGANQGAGPYPLKNAKDTVAEFLISTLADMRTNGTTFLTSSFLSNARNAAALAHGMHADPAETVEMYGTRHEFPIRYAAIGFAKATVPKELIRAYTLSQLCERAGLKPMPPENRAALMVNGAGLLPFRAPDDLDNALEGTQKAKELLQPIANIFALINNGQFSIEQNLPGIEVTWQNIQAGNFDKPFIAHLTKMIVDNRLDSAGLEQEIKKAFTAFRDNVRDYVKENGAYAFVNLYEGRFAPAANGELGTGLKTMIERLAAGRNLDNSSPTYMDCERAQADLDAMRSKIDEIKKIGFSAINGQSKAAQWAAAYEVLQKARINEKRQALALGPTGMLAKFFQQPAALLRDQLLCFGQLLERMSEMYAELGNGMTDQAKFVTVADNAPEVNIAAYDASAYYWLKNQVAAAVNVVDAKRLRAAIVSDFFANSDAWLEIPDNCYDINAEGSYELRNKDKAIPARGHFEELMNNICPSNIDVSIANMFKQYANNNMNYSMVANRIKSELFAKGRPMVNANGLPSFGYLVFPSDLAKSTDGTNIVNALKTAMEGYQFFESDDADTICLYQLAAPWEIYRQNDLKDWEKYYLNEVRMTEYHLHGMSPDVTQVSRAGMLDTYIEGIPWRDYPLITIPDADPRTIDEYGRISGEGRYLLKLDAEIAEARELGILYEDKVDGGYVVMRVNCGGNIKWDVDADEIIKNANGKLPKGKAFMDTLARQNGTTLADISRTVALETGGVLNKPMPSSELAWKYAARTLRVHIPMWIEVRNTVSLVKALYADCWASYQTLTEEAKVMAEMIEAGTFYCDDKGAWYYVDQYDFPRFVANPNIEVQFSPSAKARIDNGMLAFHLFKEQKGTMAEQEDSFTAAKERVPVALKEMAASEELDKLQANREQLKNLKQEVDIIAAKGARIDAEEEPSDQDNKKLDVQLNTVDQNDRYEAERFYYRFNKAQV